MNKCKLVFMLCMVLLVIIINDVYASVNSDSLYGKVIYLDAGHGGIDSGTLYKKIYEKDINLVMVNKIKKYLSEMGATVYLTRDSDKDMSSGRKYKKRSDLANRAYLVNKSKCDMYISIHLNYLSNSKWKGLQIFYNKRNKDNKVIANSLTEYLRGVSTNVRDYKEANNYYMYKLISRPGVLIELGFLSNVNDRYRLTHEEYQEELAKNIALAIQNYYKNTALS